MCNETDPVVFLGHVAKFRSFPASVLLDKHWLLVSHKNEFLFLGKLWNRITLVVCKCVNQLITSWRCSWRRLLWWSHCFVLLLLCKISCGTEAVYNICCLFAILCVCGIDEALKEHRFRKTRRSKTGDSEFQNSFFNCEYFIYITMTKITINKLISTSCYTERICIFFYIIQMYIL